MADQVGVILEEIGGFGIYQKFLCVVVVGAVNGLCAISFATQLFSLVTPDHWCWDPKLASLEGQLPLDQEEGKKFSLPVESTRLLPWSELERASFSKCKRYDGDLIGAYLGWMNAKRSPHYVPKTPVLGRPYPIRDCPEGWVYNHTFSTLVSDNNWVCDSKWKVYVIHAAFWLGVVVGGFVCRYLANRFGKRIALVFGMILYVFGGVIALVTSELIPLFVSRFSIGMGHFTSCHLSLQVVVVLCAEKYRAIPVIAMMVAHISGCLAVPWIARGLGSWWWLTLITTILSATVCVIVVWLVPESPWWMLMNDRNEEAKLLLRKIAQINKKESVKLNQKSLQDSSDFWTKNCDNEKHHTWLSRPNSRHDLLVPENAEMIRGKQKIVVNTVWILSGVCYYGNYYTTQVLVSTALDRTSSPSDVFLSFWYAALMEIPTWMLPLILQGRPLLQKVILGLAFSTAATVGVNHALLPAGHTELSLVFGLLNRFAVNIAYYSALQRWSENNVFERVTATSVGSSLGVGALIIPCSLYMGQLYSRLPVFIFAMVASVAALISLFLPVKTAEDQCRKTHVLHRLRHWLQTKSIRRVSVMSQKSQEDSGLTISTVSYNPLEST